MECADDAAAQPLLEKVMKDGVRALLSLPSGAVVCFVDSAGPLAAVREGGSAKAPRWVLRPFVDLAAARGPGAPRLRATCAHPRLAPALLRR